MRRGIFKFLVVLITAIESSAQTNAVPEAPPLPVPEGAVTATVEGVEG